ncbi:hypothetical protein BSIN_5375 [Burkholderia singularis]|uniref:Uncharacterized protein n=1 Tax=Burkholderia singularis TaxID=1503053 RepID=A0A238H9L5_9BURK|nr:hypothetical protein BSIN_5375 [Burkholderia singularis]
MYGNARVYDNARVSGNALVYGDARVYDNARVSGNALVSGNAEAIKADLFAILSQARVEAPAVAAALREGRVNGQLYSGKCACLVGTIANARGVDVYSDEFDIGRNSSRPAEQFFLSIAEGDTPETNPASKQALEWVEEFIAANPAAA